MSLFLVSSGLNGNHSSVRLNLTRFRFIFCQFVFVIASFSRSVKFVYKINTQRSNQSTEVRGHARGRVPLTTVLERLKVRESLRCLNPPVDPPTRQSVDDY